MKCTSYENFFKVFTNKTRLNIIWALNEMDMNVGEICEKLNEEQSKISHNLKKLLNCNFIIQKIEGKNRVYSINKQTIKPLFEIVAKHVEKYCKKECWRKK